MQVMTKVRYALKILVDIAQCSEFSLSSARIIAEQEGFSNGFIRQIMMNLRESGIITTARGRHGGIMLARPPEEITLYDVYRACSGNLYISECLTSDQHCRSNKGKPCAIHNVWEQLNTDVVNLFSAISLAKVLQEIKE